MKNILILIVFAFTFPLVADNGKGSIVSINQQIVASENKLQYIEKNLKEIEGILKDYEQLPAQFRTRFNNILEQGANCSIWQEKYQYSKKKYGKKDISTILYETELIACNNMREIRYKAMSKLKTEFNELKKLVDQLERAKDIQVTRANSIRKDIYNLLQDKKFASKVNSL